MKKVTSPLILAVMLSACSAHQPAVTGKWIGTWEKRQHLSDAELDIKDVRGDTLAFSLSATDGGNTDESEGIAILSNGVAVSWLNDGKDSCVTRFTLVGDSVVVIDQKGNMCNAGVSYSGVYKNAKLLPKQKKEYKSLVELGIFKTAKEDSVFKSLVGDRYDLFAASTQQTSEEDDLDSLHTKVYASGINGLFTIAENIVMIDADDNIWSAVIDKEKVYYFTNTGRYRDSLPKTIDAWRQRFKEYKIVYQH